MSGDSEKWPHSGRARNCVTHHMCDCTAERLKELESGIEAAAEIISDAIANHDGGARCPLDVSSAAVWLAFYDSSEG